MAVKEATITIIRGAEKKRKSRNILTKPVKLKSRKYLRRLKTRSTNKGATQMRMGKNTVPIEEEVRGEEESAMRRKRGNSSTSVAMASSTRYAYEPFCGGRRRADSATKRSSSPGSYLQNKYIQRNKYFAMIRIG